MAWRDHSSRYQKGAIIPVTVESLQAAWERDQEVIFDQIKEISRLSQKVNQLQQKLAKHRGDK